MNSLIDITAAPENVFSTQVRVAERLFSGAAVIIAEMETSILPFSVPDSEEAAKINIQRVLSKRYEGCGDPSTTNLSCTLLNSGFPEREANEMINARSVSEIVSLLEALWRQRLETGERSSVVVHPPY